MLKKIVLFTCLFLLVPCLGLSTPQQPTIEINQHNVSINIDRLKEYITLFFNHPNIIDSVVSPKITVEIYPYKDFENRVLRSLSAGSGQSFGLQRDGFIVWAYSKIDKRDHLIIYTFDSGVTDRTISHELFHWFVAFATPIGKTHSEQLIETLNLHFLGTQYYKDWLKGK